MRPNRSILDAPDWQPIAQAERLVALDIIRGVALLGVLLVNLMSDFRVPLAEHILNLHTDPGRVDRAVDVAVAFLLEFKSFTLFSLLFGVGIGVFTERAAAHGVEVTRFLIRRYFVLLAIGLCHLILIWNGDILTLYALCGFLLLPLLRLSTARLAGVGVAAIAFALFCPWGFLLPTDSMLQDLAAEAARVYSRGSFGNVLAFHWRETGQMILPLLATTLLRTLGLMALGAAAWQAGLFREPERYRRLLQTVALVGAAVGVPATGLLVYSASTGKPVAVPSVLLEAGSYLPLALAFGAGLLLALHSLAVRKACASFAAVGQMALTNYLTQSVALSLLFYGYGLGLIGRLGSAAAAVVGLILYALQMLFSVWWLRRYRFGPVEWLWRSLTYGRCQAIRRDVKE